MNENASGTITTDTIWKIQTSSVRKCLIMSSLTFILLTLIILLSSLTSTGVTDWLSKYWILRSLISSCVTGSSINNGGKGGFGGWVRKLSTKEIRFWSCCKALWNSMSCLHFKHSSQCKWSYMYYLAFALMQSWLYCHPKHLNRVLEMEGVGNLLHQVDHHHWIDEPNLQCSLFCD